MKKHPTLPRTPLRLSLVTQTEQILREAIQRHEWSNHLPGERELAAKLDVSRDTLRAALENLRSEGWIETLQRSRHRINARRAGGGGAQKPPVLGVLSPRPFSEILTPTTEIIDRLRDRLAAVGGAIEFHVSRACFSERPDRALRTLTQAHRAAAWMILGSREPMQHWFLRQGIACFVIGSCGVPDRLSSIDVDHRAIGRHAAARLLRQGHRDIALIRTRRGYGGEIDCQSGVYEVLQATPGVRLRVLYHDENPVHLGQVLDRVLRASSRPTACMVNNHWPILTVITRLLREGLHIPRDMAVIYCGDGPSATWLTPSLSRYTVPTPVFVRRAVAAVQSLLQNPAAQPRTIRLVPEFVRGETT